LRAKNDEKGSEIGFLELKKVRKYFFGVKKGDENQ
jgi:hypothetical protein